MFESPPALMGKLREALSLKGGRKFALAYAYDIVARSIPSGPKGYLVDCSG